MSDKPLSSSLLWALSDEAKKELIKMQNLGLDLDLAFSILEAEWDEADLYELPEDREDESA